MDAFAFFRFHVTVRHQLRASAQHGRQSMRKPLAGKAALVTGSSRGIGRAAALRLAQDGARVAVHCRSRREDAEDVARLIREHGGEAVVLQADLALTGAVEEMFAEVDHWLGALPLDIVVNNAAVHALAPFLEQATPETFDQTITTNLRPFLSRNPLLPGWEMGGGSSSSAPWPHVTPIPMTRSMPPPKARFAALRWHLPGIWGHAV